MKDEVWPNIWSDGRRPSFGEVLDELAGYGCNLLVTGAVPDRVAARASRRLLGAPSRSRTRLLVLTGTTVDRAADLLPPGVSVTDPDVRLVHHRTRARTATAAAPDAPEPQSADPDALVESILDALDDVREAEPEPGAVRLCLDSLSLLVDSYSLEDVRRVVRRTGDGVRAVRGTAHYRLQMADDAEPVGAVESLFDARIELRLTDGTVPEQRWHVPVYDLTTDWFRL